MNGDWFLYTTDTLAAGRPPRGKVAKGSGTGTTFRVDFETPEGGGDRVIETFVYGPLDYVALAEAQAEYDGIVDLQNDRERFQELGFQESQELNKRRKKLEKTLREMGEDPSGSGAGAKLHLHRTSAPLRVVEKAAGETYEVTLGATTQILSAGAWSDFFPVRFELSPTVEVSAITRLRVVDTDPFELYVDTLQFDPKHPTPWQPTSEPASFSPQLVDLVGARFETLGWGCMTNQVKDKMVDPRYFLEDVEFTMTYRRKLMEKMLAEDDWRVLYSVFSATDRVQHMMYADHDEGHPLHDPERAESTVTFFGEPTRLADAIPAIYRQMDAIVGDALAALRDGDTLMLCADHGFTSYRRGMNVNNWLVEEGYQVLREDLAEHLGGGGLGAVDWSKTRAYALGLGMVYLNLEGREPRGHRRSGRRRRADGGDLRALPRGTRRGARGGHQRDRRQGRLPGRRGVGEPRVPVQRRDARIRRVLPRVLDQRRRIDRSHQDRRRRGRPRADLRGQRQALVRGSRVQRPAVGERYLLLEREGGGRGR